MKTLCTLILISTALILPACAIAPPEPSLQIADRLRWSAAPTLIAKGLVPEQAYTLVTERISFWSDSATERSSLTYRADASGQIDTSTQIAEGQTEANAYFPIRNMAYLSDEAITDLSAGQLRFRLKDANGVTVLEHVVGIGPDLDTLVETPLGADFPGAYVLSRRDTISPRPTLVLLGGSEGGDGGSRHSAPIFAAEGYTVLGLPYYSPAWYGQEQQFPDLPRAFAELRVDYLEEAVAALRQRADVDPDKISLQGVSKGAEFVLLAGALIPDDSPGGGFCGIVADVPSDVIWEGWGAGSDEPMSGFSWRGAALPFVPYEEMGRALDRSDSYTMTEAHENGRAANPSRLSAARIPVELIDEPVLVIGGDKDTTWASGKMSRTIKATRDTAGLETEAYLYPEGGHGVGGTPLVRTQPANLKARLENFPATMEFLARNSRRDDCRK